MDPVASFTFETFEHRRGERFAVRETDTDLVLVLEAATDSGRPGATLMADGSVRSQFSLIFRGPGDRPLAQAMYELSHDELGDFVLFLVPVGADAEGYRYEAVFT